MTLSSPCATAASSTGRAASVASSRSSTPSSTRLPLGDARAGFVRRVSVRAGASDEYPFCIPAVGRLGTLVLNPRATFLVGENGSGKSTLVEALAVAAGFNPEGGTRNMQFETRASHSALHDSLSLEWGPRRPRNGFFLRAESF